MEIILQSKEQNMTAEIQKAIDSCFLAGGGNFKLINVENVTFEGVDGALVKCYGGEGEIRAKNLVGVARLIDHTDEPFENNNI